MSARKANGFIMSQTRGVEREQLCSYCKRRAKLAICNITDLGGEGDVWTCKSCAFAVFVELKRQLPALGFKVLP